MVTLGRTVRTLGRIPRRAAPTSWPKNQRPKFQQRIYGWRIWFSEAKFERVAVLFNQCARESSDSADRSTAHAMHTARMWKCNLEWTRQHVRRLPPSMLHRARHAVLWLKRLLQERASASPSARRSASRRSASRRCASRSACLSSLRLAARRRSALRLAFRRAAAVPPRGGRATAPSIRRGPRRQC